MKNICRPHLQISEYRMLANACNDGTFAGLNVSGCEGSTLKGTA
jgi:hypothetical protein